MGLFDFVGDAVDSVTDGARKFLGDAQQFFEKVGNLGTPEVGPSILDKWPLIHDNPLMKLAGSPILAAAQVSIGAMKLTTGSGDPEDGAEYAASAKEMHQAGTILVYADPVEDRWNGSASKAYAAKNSEHRHSTLAVSAADHQLSEILAEEARQITEARATLTSYTDFLADFDTANSWLALVPGGAVIKAKMDLAAAATHLGLAAGTLADLASDVSDNATQVSKLLEHYRIASDDVVQALNSCEPFGQEKGTDANGNVYMPPDRTTSNTYEPPVPGPIVYPPATPYGSPPPNGSAAPPVVPPTAPGALIPPARVASGSSSPLPPAGPTATPNVPPRTAGAPSPPLSPSQSVRPGPASGPPLPNAADAELHRTPAVATPSEAHDKQRGN